jgi:hypothetical protein
MNTKDVRIDSGLNKAVWSHGIRYAGFSTLCRENERLEWVCLRGVVGVLPWQCALTRLGFGCRNVAYRIRVRIERRRNEDEDAEHEFYSYVSHVPVTKFKGTSGGRAFSHHAQPSVA